MISTPGDGTQTDQALEDMVAHLAALALGEKSGPVGPDDPLLSGEAGFDSVSLMEFVLRLEDTFGVSIPDEDLDPDIFYSVKSIAAYLRARPEPEI